jgi:hypothetical protein
VVLARVRRGSAARHRSAVDLQVIVPTAGERERWRRDSSQGGILYDSPPW